MMESKRGKNVLSTASKLDAITNSDGEITKLAIAIVEDKNDSVTVELCKKISVFADSETKQIVQMAQCLKNDIISYYGYIRVCEICNMNQKEKNDEEKSLPKLLKELDELVGLEKVKVTVNNLIAYQKVQKLREKEGLFSQRSTLHLAFTGNPGTGKTTVARIVGRIYKQIGLLSKGHFLEVSRTDLIAGYQGQTALKVKNVIERAKGGVLFIDEAYSITENDHADSYGRECLTELTKALEDYRDDLIVIVAGYTEPMKLFFKSNPGLKSRFNTFIEFDDYNENELNDIMLMMCEKNDYVLSQGAADKVRIALADRVEHKGEGFANGRLVRNLYEDIVMNHARRVNKIENPNHRDLMEIVEEDIAFLEILNHNLG